MGLFSKMTPQEAVIKLMQAVHDGNIKNAKRALDAGADIEFEMDFAVNKNGKEIAPKGVSRTPLFVALLKDDRPMAKLLLERGADPFRLTKGNSQSAFNLAITEYNDVFVADVVARHKIKEVAPESGLSTAAFSGSIRALDILLKTGIDPNQKRQDGKTVLQLLMSELFWEPEAATRLLNAGADLTLVDASKSKSWPKFIDDYKQKLRTHIDAGEVTRDHLIKDGKPTELLTKYCAAGMLQELFTEQRWHGREEDGLKLFDQILQVVPDYYRERLPQQLDLAPLRREQHVEEDRGAMVERYVRKPTKEMPQR